MLGLLLLSLMRIAAPRTDGSIIGAVRDAASGHALPGATVVAADAGRQVTTDADGRYALRGMPAGPQHIVVRAMGHAPYTLHAVVPRQGVLALDVALEPIATRLPIVAVRHFRDAPGPSSGTHAGAADRSVQASDLRRHPMLAEPDFLRAIAGGDVNVAPETPGGLHVRGGSADHTGYLVDGIPVFNPYHASDLMGAWNTDVFEGARLDAPVSGASTLSGNLMLTSRTPGAQRHAAGAMSTTHGRLAMDGPLGIGPTSFLVSARTAWPNLVAPENDPTFVRGRSGDLYAKVESPLAHGVMRAFTTRALDGASLATVPPEAIGVQVSGRRNTFDWSSTTTAVRWEGPLGVASLLVSAWRSTAAVGGTWDEGAVLLRSRRVEHGTQVEVARRGNALGLRAGARFESARMGYRVREDGATTSDIRSDIPLLTAFGDAERAIGDAASIGLGVSATRMSGRGYLSPRLEGRVTLSEHVNLSATMSRRHQFAQSLRNPESAVGFVFPADLAVGAAPGGIPVASSDEASVAADVRAAPGARARVSAYARAMRGVVLVAPFEEAPFLRGTPVTGTATATGASLEGELRSARYLALARYGVQLVRYRHAQGSYIPSWSPRAQLDGGITAFPTATMALRLGVNAAFGRRVTPATGPLEWESCNLKDRGCEFAGSPRAEVALLGTTRAPAYVRVDVGVRKHGHLRLGSRQAEVAVFGTYSNLLQRFNVLTYGLVGDTRTPLEMRPASPLVVGLDWRY